MNIALIGSGGREHAICQKLNESPLTKKIFCIPGNAGTEKVAKNLNFDPLNFKKLLIAVRFYKIDLVVIGPELPIVVKADGLAAGKGVVICKTSKEVEKFSNEIFKGKFKSSKKLVLEEFLSGEEASYFLIVDKKGFAFLVRPKIIKELERMKKDQILVAWVLTHLLQ